MFKNNKKSLLVLSLFGILLASCSGTTIDPSKPSDNPTIKDPTTNVPTEKPSENPSEKPSEIPSENPTEKPTENPTENPTEKPVEPDTPSLPNVELNEGIILHAFNWSLKNIKDNLPKIKEAGFDKVQTSPMQPQKDYYQGGHWRSQWWKLYQPLGFSIATEKHALGTKQDLIDLCNEAQKYDIDIIVDVVANHLGGGNRNSFHQDVKKYEPEIYNADLIHKNYGQVNDNTIENVVKGHLGDFPDLMTESTVVQTAVLDLLKEYLDCGVKGFRFDAAKHIETPDDEECASNFWPFVIEGSKEYAKSKNYDIPYYYGEILHTVGTGRKYSSYTKYMSVTDSDMSHDTLAAVKSKDVDTLITVNEYKAPVENVVVWGESHDTYSNDNHETTNVPVADINKAYAIQASKRGTTNLYFDRPDNNNALGQIGQGDCFKPEIKEINNFHHEFGPLKDKISKDKGYFINERFNDNKSGVMLVNIEGKTGNVELNVPNMLDGTYNDQISGSQFIVKNHILTGNVKGDISVIYHKEAKFKPIITFEDGNSTLFKDTKDITINVENADSMTYQINNGEKKSFNNSIKIHLGDDININEYQITVEASNEWYAIKNSKKYIKSNMLNYDVIISNIDKNILDDYSIVAWIWKSGNNGKWVDVNVVDELVGFNVDQENNFILVLFNKGTNASNADWSKKVKQTGDTPITSQFIDGSTLQFK